MNELLIRIQSVLVYHTQADGGLISSLRPYCGRVDPNVLKELTNAIAGLRQEAEKGTEIPTEFFSLIFHLTHLCRWWALDPDSMLASNNLITPVDSQVLLDWVRAVEGELSWLMDKPQGA